MAPEKIAYERIPGFENVIRIPLAKITDSNSVVEILQNTFDACFENGDTKIIVDLNQFEYPSTSLIALLIEATSRARRLNGDVKIVNSSRSAKNNMTMFSPLSFLSLEGEESRALEEFAEMAMPAEQSVLPSVSESLKEEIAEDHIDRIARSFENQFVESDNKKEQLRVGSEADNLYDICDFVTRFARKAGFSEKEIGKTKIAVYEACLNIVEHAYHSNPDNWIDVSVHYDHEKMVIEIVDYGIGFEGVNSKDYDVMDAVKDRQTGGFGLYIIRRAMDEVEYQPDEKKGNRLTLTKYLKRVEESTEDHD